ncbi:MAG: acetolactate synthase-1/2/3 large subunit [Methanobacteriota archaeon]|jgi:acetolactate synthase-1/2/3 large subunit|uniref:Acetolactate synthase large subunit n=1 Tax=Halorutilus salinus TaxID=2487751 RepID=A0A9Q4C7I6_9EURY|nr:acetolactate synthase large subunit [Halorutilus salinus]MCX2819706.1 acetolactate synthase large subunit [Halorutilus salinus]
MRASDVLVSCLEDEGVEHVFGVPGEENEDLLFSLRGSSVEFVPTRHEQGAAFAANVFGRLTGDAGVCLGTLGPGATNLITGVADANLDKAPLVAITGQGGLERLHKESHQALNIVNMFSPITKWNAQISDPDIVHESVRKAFKVAEYEKPGATHIELPEDVASEETDAVPMPVRDPVRRPDPDSESTESVARFLHEAEKPILIVGNGATRTEAADEVRALVEKTDIPVASTYMGKGVVSDDDPRSLMTLDSGDHEEASHAIDEADLVVTLGYDIAEHDPAGWNAGDAAVVHIDAEPAEVYEAYSPDVEVVADVGAAVRELRPLVDEDEYGWYDDLRDHIVTDVAGEADTPFSVEGVVPVLRDRLNDEDVLISDVGSHKMRIAQNYPTYEPNTCIISNGLASMGIAVPGGIGADLAVDANVVAATGDGGFLMNAAELETATRLGCGYTVVVFRDDDYGLISEKQTDHRGEGFGTRLSNPDLTTFAESFGIEAYSPDTADGLHGALGSAVASDGMALVEVDMTEGA